MIQIKFAFGSQAGRKVVPPDDRPKLNEDDLFVAVDANAVGIFDGNPVFPNSKGKYPSKREGNGRVAACAAARSICKEIRSVHGQNWSSSILHDAFFTANNAVCRENKKRGLYDQEPPRWLATVGCVSWIDSAREMACHTFIGDPLTFVLGPGQDIQLLTKDQLHPFESHLATHGYKNGGSTRALRLYQDTYLRNQQDAKCPLPECGEIVRGFGELDGTWRISPFIETCEFPVVPGMRIIHATDGFEVVGGEDGKERKAEDYAEALFSIDRYDPEIAVEQLLKLTAAAEIKKGSFDDKSFALMYIGA